MMTDDDIIQLTKLSGSYNIKELMSTIVEIIQLTKLSGSYNQGHC